MKFNSNRGQEGFSYFDRKFRVPVFCVLALSMMGTIYCAIWNQNDHEVRNLVWKFIIIGPRWLIVPSVTLVGWLPADVYDCLQIFIILGALVFTALYSRQQKNGNWKSAWMMFRAYVYATLTTNFVFGFLAKMILPILVNVLLPMFFKFLLFGELDAGGALIWFNLLLLIGVHVGILSKPSVQVSKKIAWGMILFTVILISCWGFWWAWK